MKDKVILAVNFRCSKGRQPKLIPTDVMSCFAILLSAIGHLFYFLHPTTSTGFLHILFLGLQLCQPPSLSLYLLKLCERLFSKYRKVVLMIQILMLVFFFSQFLEFLHWISNHKETEFKASLCFWYNNFALKFLTNTKHITFQTKYTQ